MADLSFGGGGGGGGYYPPVFDPNNPMGSGGYTPPVIVLTPEQIAANAQVSYYVYTKRYADPAYDTNYFANNLNAANPYTKTYEKSLNDAFTSWGWIEQSGNEYTVVKIPGTLRSYSYTVTNNAHTDFENKATAAQNAYLSQQQIAFTKANDKATSDLTSSYSNVRDSSIQNKVQTLADIKSQISELKYQDDITKYLNRVGDTNNAERIAELERQAAILDADVSRDVLKYWQDEELSRKKSRQDWNFGTPQWLSDPYFGRGGGEPRFIGDSAQQDTKIFFDLHALGDISDWMAGGTMYDSPRAGDVLFNAMGNLNTTVFLGLENKNFGFNMTESYANPSVFKQSFKAMAGDAGFSVLSFG